MSLVKIKPEKRTKIAEGSCAIKVMNNTYIIHITDEDKNVLASTYANNSQEIKSDKAVYAESTKYPLEIEVIGNETKELDKNITKKTKPTTKDKEN